MSRVTDWVARRRRWMGESPEFLFGGVRRAVVGVEGELRLYALIPLEGLPAFRDWLARVDDEPPTPTPDPVLASARYYGYDQSILVDTPPPSTAHEVNDALQRHVRQALVQSGVLSDPDWVLPHGRPPSEGDPQARGGS